MFKYVTFQQNTFLRTNMGRTTIFTTQNLARISKCAYVSIHNIFHITLYIQSTFSPIYKQTLSNPTFLYTHSLQKMFSLSLYTSNIDFILSNLMRVFTLHTRYSIRAITYAPQLRLTVRLSNSALLHLIVRISFSRWLQNEWSVHPCSGASERHRMGLLEDDLAREESADPATDHLSELGRENGNGIEFLAFKSRHDFLRNHQSSAASPHEISSMRSPIRHVRDRHELRRQEPRRAAVDVQPMASGRDCAGKSAESGRRSQTDLRETELEEREVRMAADGRQLQHSKGSFRTALLK